MDHQLAEACVTVATACLVVLPGGISWVFGLFVLIERHVGEVAERIFVLFMYLGVRVNTCVSLGYSFYLSCRLTSCRSHRACGARGARCVLRGRYCGG